METKDLEKAENALKQLNIEPDKIADFIKEYIQEGLEKVKDIPIDTDALKNNIINYVNGKLEEKSQTFKDYLKIRDYKIYCHYSEFDRDENRLFWQLFDEYTPHHGLVYGLNILNWFKNRHNLKKVIFYINFDEDEYLSNMRLKKLLINALDTDIRSGEIFNLLQYFQNRQYLELYTIYDEKQSTKFIVFEPGE